MLLDSGSPTVISLIRGRVHAARSPVSACMVIMQPVVPLAGMRIGAAEFQTWVPWRPPDARLGAWLRGHHRASVDGLDHVDAAIGSTSRLSESALAARVPAGRRRDADLPGGHRVGRLADRPPGRPGAHRRGARAGAPPIATLASTAGGRIATRLTWAAADLSLGQSQLAAVPLATTTALPEGQGIMGNAFLDDFVGHHRLDGRRALPGPGLGRSGPEVPLSVSPTWHDGFVVGSVVEGAPGTTGIELDAPILAIDGEDVGRATVDDACRRLTDASRPPTSLTVAGDVPIDVAVGPVRELLRRAQGDRSWLRRLIPIR